MRCLGIAEAWPGRCAFASAVTDPQTETLLRTAGVGLVRLHADDAEGRCAELAREAERHGVAGLVLDSDEIDPRTEAVALASGLPVLRLDDEAGHNPYRSHLLLNHCWGAEALPYAAAGRTARLLGPAYYPVRQALRELPREREPVGPIHRLLVLLTAGESTGLARRIVRQLVQHEGPTLRAGVVLDTAIPGGMARLAAGGRHRISLGTAPPDLAPYLRAADAAVTGSARCAYDLAATGVPLLLCSERAPGAEARGLAASGAGFVSSLEAGALEDALSELLALGASARRAMGASGRESVDGAGADRVCRSLLELIG